MTTSKFIHIQDHPTNDKVVVGSFTSTLYKLDLNDDWPTPDYSNLSVYLNGLLLQKGVDYVQGPGHMMVNFHNSGWLEIRDIYGRLLYRYYGQKYSYMALDLP